MAAGVKPVAYSCQLEHPGRPNESVTTHSAVAGDRAGGRGTEPAFDLRFYGRQYIETNETFFPGAPSAGAFDVIRHLTYLRNTLIAVFGRRRGYC